MTYNYVYSPIGPLFNDCFKTVCSNCYIYAVDSHHAIGKNVRNKLGWNDNNNDRKRIKIFVNDDFYWVFRFANGEENIVRECINERVESIISNNNEANEVDEVLHNVDFFNTNSSCDTGNEIDEQSVVSNNSCENSVLANSHIDEFYKERDRDGVDEDK